MANKDNQSKQYRIYIKESKSWVDVNKEFYTNYYRDINAYRKRQQEHGRCVCPASKRYLCDICYETHQKAKDILEGRKIDPTFYPVIYGADEADAWTDPEVWKKANPSLGITVGIDKVEAACESAKQNPGEENSFRQLRLNQWVKQAVRWMPMEKWDACSFKLDEESLEGRVCYGGLDLSSTTDITAFVLVFPPLDEDDKFCILPYFWIPEDTLDLRVRRDHVPYDVWERQGFLETTEGNVVHYGEIHRASWRALQYS